MISLLVIGFLIGSLAIGKTKPKAAAVLDLIVALLLLFFRIIPGTADFIDWILMIAMFLGAGFFMFGKHLEIAASGGQSASLHG